MRKRNHRDNTGEKRATDWPELEKKDYGKFTGIDDDFHLEWGDSEESSGWPERSEDDDISNELELNHVPDQQWGDTKEADPWPKLERWEWDDEEVKIEADVDPSIEPAQSTGWPELEKWEYEPDPEVDYPELDVFPGDFDPVKKRVDYNSDQPNTISDQLKEMDRLRALGKPLVSQSMSRQLDNQERQAKAIEIRKRNERQKKQKARNSIEQQELAMLDSLIDLVQQSIDGSGGDINQIDLEAIRGDFYLLWKDFKDRTSSS